MNPEKPTLVPVEVYDSEGPITIQGVRDVYRLFLGMQAINAQLPGNVIPYIKLGEA